MSARRAECALPRIGRAVLSTILACALNGCAHIGKSSLAVPLLPESQNTISPPAEHCSSQEFQADIQAFDRFVSMRGHAFTAHDMSAYRSRLSPGFGIRIVSGAYTELPGGVRSYYGPVTFYVPCVVARGTVTSMVTYPSGYASIEIGCVPRGVSGYIETGGGISLSPSRPPLSTVAVVPASACQSPPPQPTPTQVAESRGPSCPIVNQPAHSPSLAQPDFPQSAMRQRLPAEVDVVVDVSLSASGAVTNAVVSKSSGDAAIDADALRVVRDSTYSPKIINCKAVPSHYLYEAEYNSG